MFLIGLLKAGHSLTLPIPAIHHASPAHPFCTLLIMQNTPDSLIYHSVPAGLEVTDLLDSHLRLHVTLPVDGR